VRTTWSSVGGGAGSRAASNDSRLASLLVPQPVADSVLQLLLLQLVVRVIDDDVTGVAIIRRII